MSDSPPNRRSSIPILKQSNKTKSFQSFVNLNLNDESSAVDGSSSGAKSGSSSISPTENFPKSKPVKHNLPKLVIDNDIVITKLCEENKRLKDHQTQLISKYEEGMFVGISFAIISNVYFFKHYVKTWIYKIRMMNYRGNSWK